MWRLQYLSPLCNISNIWFDVQKKEREKKKRRGGGRKSSVKKSELAWAGGAGLLPFFVLTEVMELLFLTTDRLHPLRRAAHTSKWTCQFILGGVPKQHRSTGKTGGTAGLFFSLFCLEAVSASFARLCFAWRHNRQGLVLQAAHPTHKWHEE